MLTIDASVWLNADSPHEPNQAASRAFLDRVAVERLRVFAPTLLGVEVAAAISRTRNDPTLARDFATSLIALPFVTFVSLDEPLAAMATELAAVHKLRGADAVYAAVALAHRCDLVSLDREHLTRLSGVLRTVSPEQWLAEAPPQSP